MAVIDTKQVKASTKELGATGTVILGGLIQDDEYNSDLNGSARFDVVDKMKKGDATVRAALLVVKLPILSANWYIQPASGDKRDQDIADAVKYGLMEAPSRSWQEFLQEALLYLDYGHYLFEKVWKVAEYNGKQMVVLHKLSPRLPRTIYRWETETGEMGITQHTIAKGFTSIPIDKLVVFTNEKEGDNWTGQTILRSAYRHWYIKDKLYTIDAIAYERQGLGIPYVKPPVNAGKADKAKARELIRNIRANEEGYLDIPMGWEVGFLDMKSSTTRNPEVSIKHHDRQIVKSVLAQFIELGATSSGSYALQEGQGDMFLLAEQSYANQIRDTIQKYVVEPLVDMNYDNVKEYPKLMYERIGTIDINNLSTALQRYVQAGILTYDEELERYIRNVSSFPDKPEGEDLPDDFGLDMVTELETELGQTQAELDGEAFVEANPADEDLTDEELDQAADRFMDDLQTGAGPISDEHKQKISEALKRYWEGRKKQILATGKKGKKGKKMANPKIKKAQKEIRELNDELRKFREGIQRERLELEAKGIKLTKEERAKKQLELMDKKSQIGDKVAKLRKDIDDIKAASEPKEEPDDPENPDNPDNTASDRGFRAFIKSFRNIIRGKI